MILGAAAAQADESSFVHTCVWVPAASRIRAKGSGCAGGNCAAAGNDAAASKTASNPAR
jgi:hypothetical protein